MMTIDEFLARAPNTLLAWEAASREGIAAGEFKALRTEDDWWAEVLAYVRYIELEEKARRLGIEP